MKGNWQENTKTHYITSQIGTQASYLEIPVHKKVINDLEIHSFGISQYKDEP